MVMFDSSLRRIGNSMGLLVPSVVVKDLDLREGDEISVTIRPPQDSDRLLTLLEMAGSVRVVRPFKRDREDRF